MPVWQWGRACPAAPEPQWEPAFASVWECRQEPGSLPVVPQWSAGDGAIAFHPADWFGNLYKTAPGLGVDVVVGL